MFKVHFPIEAIRRKLGNVEKRIEREQKNILEAVGVKLLSFAMQDYRTKSRGGVGSDGITWKPLKPATIKSKNRRGSKRKTTKSGKARPGIGSSAIGIDTGLQQNSAAPGFSGPDGKGGNVMLVTENDVTVGYGRSYSGYFDEERPLLPEKLPVEWKEECEKLVARQVEKIIREGLK